MNKVVSQFLDRLSERFIALLAGLVSSRIEGLHAASQAEQQSNLEDLARQYDAAGKSEIATNLRIRATGLNSSNLASEALEIVQNVAGEPLYLAAPQDSGQTGDMRGIPSFVEGESVTKPKRPRASESKKSSDIMGDLL